MAGNFMYVQGLPKIFYTPLLTCTLFIYFLLTHAVHMTKPLQKLSIHSSARLLFHTKSEPHSIRMILHRRGRQFISKPSTILPLNSISTSFILQKSLTKRCSSSTDWDTSAASSANSSWIRYNTLISANQVYYPPSVGSYASLTTSSISIWRCTAMCTSHTLSSAHCWPWNTSSQHSH